MNSSAIERNLCTDIKVRESFIGVFAADNIPWEKEYPGLYIVNTDPSNLPGQHWVAFYATEPGVLEAFDSYGRNPAVYSEHIKLWMGSDYIIHSNTVRQNTSSTVCGQYCMFYVVFRCNGFSYEDIMSAFGRHKGINDKFVCKFINKHFGLRASVHDKQFLTQYLKHG